MLDRQHRRVDRAQPGVGDDERCQAQAYCQIVEDNALFFVPAQRANDAAASFHRQIVVFRLSALKRGFHTIEIHRLPIEFRREMRGNRFLVNVGNKVFCRLANFRNLVHIESVAGKKLAVCSLFRAADSRLIVPGVLSRLSQFFNNERCHVRLANVCPGAGDKNRFPHIYCSLLRFFFALRRAFLRPDPNPRLQSALCRCGRRDAKEYVRPYLQNSAVKDHPV